MLQTLLDISFEEKIELIFSDRDLAENEKVFIELLYFSPLHRCGLNVDIILRRIGMKIHSAYIERMSMDLIIGEKKKRKKEIRIL